MNQSPSELPVIRLIPLGPGAPVSVPKRPADLRWARVEEFFQARSLAANTQKAYRRELKRFLQWTDRSWTDLTPRQVAQYKKHLIDLGLASNSVNRALTALMSFFDWFRHAYPEQIQHDPTQAVQMEQVPLPPARDLSETEVAALFAALEQRGEAELRDTALLAVLSHGLRAEEVVNLNVGDYDGVRLTIRKAKDDSTGTVPLSQRAREQINTYLIERQNEGEELVEENPLFLAQGRNRLGKRLGYQGLYYVVKELGTISGIKDLTPHRLRHTYATGLLLRGVDSLHARTLTRHKSESSFKRYAKRALAAAAERAFYEAIEEEVPKEVSGNNIC